MDSLITAAARALAQGDPLGALKRVALRNDAPALALRGIAIAQLGDFERARTLLRSAQRAFSPKESVARATESLRDMGCNGMPRGALCQLRQHLCRPAG